jgi:hypothetical protein
VKRSISRTFGPRIVALLLAAVALTATSGSNAAVYLSVTIAPPALPVYEQPLIPGPGYIWTPGYWAWGPEGYYWVPGTWVLAPFAGALWTPGYWGWGESAYIWHTGYWGPHVGFYGGICYGFGYTGFGYQGGYWDRGSFRYNRAVNNVNVTNITNTYNTTVVNNSSTTRVSYNGGSGGVLARPRPEDRIAERERHTPVLPVQAHHELAAASNRALLASVNNGRPPVAATPRPQPLAAGTAPARSFSQQAAVQPHPVPPANSGAGRTPRVTNGQQLERPDARVNAAAPQGSPPARMYRQVPTQGQARPEAPPQSQMRPQGQPRPDGPAQPQMRPQGQARPEGPAQAQMRPQGPARPPAQRQPQAVASQQGGPPREARGPHGPSDHPGER